MNEKDLDYFETLMEDDQNDPEIQYQIAICYLHGKGVAEDKKTAEKWLRWAAEQGHEGAENLLHIPQKKEEEAVATEDTLPDFCLRAEEGDPEAQYAVGVYFKTENPKEAQQYLTMAAEQGHGKASFELGEIYFYDKQIPNEKAVELMRNAADCGLNRAMHWLGRCYLHGWGVEQNSELGRQWMEKFGTHGSAEEKLTLALMFAKGEEVEQSQGKTMLWIKYAENAGMDDARERFRQATEEYNQQKEALAQQEEVRRAEEARHNEAWNQREEARRAEEAQHREELARRAEARRAEKIQQQAEYDRKMMLQQQQALACQVAQRQVAQRQVEENARQQEQATQKTVEEEAAQQAETIKKKNRSVGRVILDGIVSVLTFILGILFLIVGTLWNWYKKLFAQYPIAGIVVGIILVVVLWKVGGTAVTAIKKQAQTVATTVTEAIPPEVKGLEEIDPFEFVEVKWSGTAPYGWASLYNNAVDQQYARFSYSMDNSSELSNGDFVTITATWSESGLADDGYFAEITEKVVQVEGLDYYATSGTDIGQTCRASMEQQSVDIIETYLQNSTAKTVVKELFDISVYTTPSPFDVDFTQLTLVKTYFQQLKGGYESETYNRYICVYSLPIQIDYDGNKTDIAYFAVSFCNITNSPQGVSSVDLSESTLLDATATWDTIEGSASRAYKESYAITEYDPRPE